MTRSTLRNSIYSIIFEANTRAGKAFDIALFVVIGLSVFSIMLESIPSFQVPSYLKIFWIIESATTLIFTVEYLLRLWSSPSTKSYTRSFYGVIDLLSILPFYLSVMLPGSATFTIIRSLRLLRIFRVLKLSRFLLESNLLLQSLVRSSRKIGVFLFTVVLLCIIMGTFMYAIEGPENGFTSIPLSIYWAIVTLTTVGYGDIAPSTVIGQLLASVIMILGYAIIAVPTGIVTVDLTTNSNTKTDSILCTSCNHSLTVEDKFCSNCGTQL